MGELLAIYVRFAADNGQHIRRWGTKPFDGATKFVPEATPITDDVVERVARALHLVDEPVDDILSIDWEGLLEDTQEHYRIRARAAISTFAVPEGWKLVPVEPTAAMTTAGHTAWMRKAHDIFSATPTEHPEDGNGPMGYAYRAMLSAAPKVSLPPQPKPRGFQDA